jgi:hypothetical protein
MGFGEEEGRVLEGSHITYSKTRGGSSSSRLYNWMYRGGWMGSRL